MVSTDIVERLIRYQNGQTIEGTSVDMARTALSEIEKLRAEVERSRTVTLPPVPNWVRVGSMHYDDKVVPVQLVEGWREQIVAALRAAGVEVSK